MNLWHLMPNSSADAPGADVVRDVRSIQAISVRELSVPESQAAAILDAMGLAHAEARAALTVLDGMGALGGAWTGDPIAMSRLESAAALSTAAAATSLSQVAVRMFNASVSLVEVSGPTSLHARMMLNLLGLRWSLLLSDDLLDALDRLQGLDCAAAFLRVVWQYLDEGYDHPEAWSAVNEFAALLSDLAGRLPRNRPSLVAGVATFAEAAGQLRLRIATIQRDTGRDIDVAELADATTRTIDALRLSGTSPRTGVVEDNLLDSATLLRGIFVDLLGQARWGLLDTVSELVSLRDRAREEFIARYARFTAPDAAPVVIAGALTRDEWREVEARFLRDPGSIIPVVADEFPAD